jgi:hypothetical protein
MAVDFFYGVNSTPKGAMDPGGAMRISSNARNSISVRISCATTPEGRWH